MIITPPTTCLVSSCLMGLCTRYDALVKTDTECIKLLKNSDWLPVCPEQLGGLPTPREKSQLSGGDGYAVLAGSAKVVTASGRDVSASFILGAHQVLQIARARSVSTAILKAKSPSCGVSGTIGVTAALLKSDGVTLYEF